MLAKFLNLLVRESPHKITESKIERKSLHGKLIFKRQRRRAGLRGKETGAMG